MHINLDTINGVSSVNVMAVIKSIADNNNPAAPFDTYPGIASVSTLFRNHGTTETGLRQIFDLDKYDMPYRRNEANTAYSNMSTDMQIQFTTMDWFQMFALAHIPEDLWYLVDLPMYYSDEAFLGAYDRALRIAYRSYMMKSDAYIQRQRIASQNEMLNADAKYIIDQTKAHDGCDEGKMQFLKGIQFIDHDLWEEDFTREFDVVVDISYRTSITVSVPANHDTGDYISDYVADYQFDLAYETPDEVDVIDYSEA